MSSRKTNCIITRNLSQTASFSKDVAWASLSNGVGSHEEDSRLRVPSHVIREDFNKPRYKTRGVETDISQADITGMFILIDARVMMQGSADYMQRFVIEGKRVWVIDNGEYVTMMLPEEY